MPEIAYGQFNDGTNGLHDFTAIKILTYTDMNDIDNGVYDCVVETNNRIETINALNSNITEADEYLDDQLDILQPYEEGTLAPKMRSLVNETTPFVKGTDDRLITDLDSIVTFGGYLTSTKALHSPVSNALYPNGELYLLCLGYGDNICQICVEGSNITIEYTDPITGKTRDVEPGRVFTRYKKNGNWSSWVPLFQKYHKNYKLDSIMASIKDLSSRITILEDYK